jgi:hypothetical protein
MTGLQDVLQRFTGNLFERLDGPLHFRFFVQPLVALIFGFLDGWKDAAGGKPVYLWTIILDPGSRKAFLQNGWKAIGRIFVLAVVLDMVYQAEVLRRIYPGEMLTVAFLLTIVPYVLIRDAVNWLMRLVKSVLKHLP